MRMQDRAPGFLFASMATAALTAVLLPFRSDLGLLNAGFLFLLLTLLVASYWGLQVGLLQAIVANLVFNFFFIEPRHEFSVQEPRNILALVVFLIVSVVGGTLIAIAREAAARAQSRQAETEVALALSRAMSGHMEPQAALQALCSQAIEAFAAAGASVLTTDGQWTVLAWAGDPSAARPPATDEKVSAEAAIAHGTPIGVGATGLARRGRIVIPRGRSKAFPARQRDVCLVPLRVADETLGLLRLDGPFGNAPFRADPNQLLGAVAAEAALAVQRVQLASRAAHAEALRQADEMKTALLASISHDLKTPLASIKAAVSSLLDQGVVWTPEDIEAFHHTIDSQTDRLNRVISGVLDLSRIESGALTPEQTPVRVIRLLDSARDVTRFETRGREVTVIAPPDLTLTADESLLHQAIVNLIENAAKYSTPEGAIRLEARAEGDAAVIDVSDEGPGIATEDLAHVFDRFYRGEEHSRRVSGSGLGLTIVKGFVVLCGGTVGVKSSPAGTTFTIRLPLAVPVGAPA